MISSKQGPLYPDPENPISMEQFFELLRATPQDWTVTGGRMIRPWPGEPGKVDEGQCPVSACVDLPAYEVVKAAMKLTIRYVDMTTLISAADHPESVSLRQQLLEACGLA